MDKITLEQIEWSADFFASMAEGGLWAIPIATVVLQKRGKKLVVLERMPFSVIENSPRRDAEGVPKSAAELRAFQDSHLEQIASRFKLAGIDIDKD